MQPYPSRAVERTELDILIVGGSLTGLSTALAFARCGRPTTVIERASGPAPHGAGIGLEPALLSRVTGIDADRIPVVVGNRLSASWGHVHTTLLDAAHRNPLIHLQPGTTVSGVTDDPTANRIGVALNGKLAHPDLIIGADGGRSIVRQYVNPEHPHARYAGYLIWRALLDESTIPGGIDGRGDAMEFYSARGHNLTVYCVPGRDGSTTHGNRCISFAWYDRTRTDLLHNAGALRNGYIIGPLRSDELTPDLLRELRLFALQQWPEPWSRAIATAIDGGHLFATPIAGYKPRRLARGRAIIIGDAAHLAGPTVGAGFRTSLHDIESLVDRLCATTQVNDIPAMLREVEADRLQPAQRLVQSM